MNKTSVLRSRELKLVRWEDLLLAVYISMFLFTSVVICQSTDDMTSNLDPNLITNEISKNESKEPDGPSNEDESDLSNSSGIQEDSQTFETQVNEISSETLNDTDSEDAGGIAKVVTGEGQNPSDTVTQELDDETGQGPMTPLNEDQTGNTDTGTAMGVEEAMDQVTEELQKAIEKVKENQVAIEDNLKGTFNEPLAKLKDTASQLEAKQPLLKTTLQTTLDHEGQLQSFFGQSSRNDRKTISNFASSFTKLNSGMIASLLRQWVAMYVETIMPTFKMLEVQYFVSLVQQELDGVQREYEIDQGKFYSEQLLIVAGLNKEELSKQEILDSLEKVSENLKTHQRDEQSKLPTVFNGVREKVDTSVSQIKDHMDKLLRKLKVDQQGLTKAMDVQKSTLEAVMGAGLCEIKKIYILRATQSMEQLADQEINYFKNYLAVTGELDDSWIDLENKANSVIMGPSYVQHEDIAMGIEDSRSAIQRLPNMIRAVKVRTITQALAYLTLSMIVFGAVSVGVVCVLLVIRLIQAFVAQELKKNPSQTNVQKVDFWRQRRPYAP